MISTKSSSHITRAFMPADSRIAAATSWHMMPCNSASDHAAIFVDGKRIFLLLSAAISCSLAVVALATAQSPPVPPVTSQTDVTLSPSAQRGFILVRFHCAHCRAIDKVSESPLASAPAFRNLRLKYAVADLQRPLLQAELVHPRLDLKADQVEDVMAYFKSLEQ
jgi:hypothetical protein